jgi:hypothetical protein
LQKKLLSAMIFLTIFLSFFLSITLAQQIGPIVPTNRNFYGPPYQTMGGGYSGMHYPIQPINAPQQPWPPSSGYGAHDFMPYRPNTIQGVPSFNPYPGTLGMSAGGMDAISPINSYSNQMPIESSPALPNRNSVMAPIQVVYGKSVGMETQNEATTPSSSLPLFLQGASEDVIDEVWEFLCVILAYFSINELSENPTATMTSKLRKLIN